MSHSLKVSNRIRRIYGQCRAWLFGFNPYDVHDSYRILLPLTKEQAQAALEVGDVVLGEAAHEAREVFNARIASVRELQRQERANVVPLPFRD